MKKYLGIDYGLSKTGFATGDDILKIASPLKVVRTPDMVEVIVAVIHMIREEDISALVVGVPLSTDGTHSAQTQSVLEFIEVLKQKVTIPVFTEDERFTSQSADRLLKETRDKDMQDAVAAMLLLQLYLDKLP
jgi:putative Holliday junction resolvase